jgi:CDP-diacylglycerol--glycerol-3-phosphate 3-phosphatidyltransferase
MEEARTPVKLNLPNRITIARILTIPVVVYMLVWLPDPKMAIAAAVLVVIASLSDILDGYLARKRNEITSLGKLLDPIADKLLLIAIMIPLIELNRIPAWMGVLLLGREMAVTGLRAVAAGEGIVIPAGRIGKHKATLETIALVILILDFPLFGIDLHAVGIIVLLLALVAATVSGIEYFVSFLKRLPADDGKVG